MRPIRLRALLAAALLGLVLAARTSAQSASDSSAASPAAAALPSAASLLENPVRRFEIVSLGAFPIMLFYSDFGFDLQRYVANNFNALYAPWPFKTPSSAPITDTDRFARIGVALGACVIVGAIDAYIHAKKVQKARLLREAQGSLQ